MKTTIEKEFDAVKYMPQQINTLSQKLSKMTKSEDVAYFKHKEELGVKIQPGA